MPYSRSRYGSKKKFRKMKHCIAAVKKKSRKVNQYAVCRASVYHKKRKRSRKK